MKISTLLINIYLTASERVNLSGILGGKSSMLLYNLAN